MFSSKIQVQQFAMLATAFAALAFAGSSVNAQDVLPSKAQDQARDQVRLQDPTYGAQLMTEAERTAHRAHMRTLKTTQEREAYQLEQHKRMQERAREKGITLPAEPPAMGKGMAAAAGSGAAMGGGMGGGGSAAGAAGSKGTGSPGGGMGGGTPGKK